MSPKAEGVSAFFSYRAKIPQVFHLANWQPAKAFANIKLHYHKITCDIFQLSVYFLWNLRQGDDTSSIPLSSKQSPHDFTWSEKFLITVFITFILILFFRFTFFFRLFLILIGFYFQILFDIIIIRNRV